MPELVRRVPPLWTAGLGLVLVLLAGIAGSAPALFADEWWTSRPEFKEFINIAKTGVPISYKSAPSAASGEILATNLIPEAMQAVLVEGVDPATAVGEAQKKIKAIFARLG